ncbi:hypothetical protein [Bacillus sp. JJ722]|uniref:hypothetical protein n=1 Tax=Bacillus sp. JJ722 TaxID=3122973 RepID=UPI002FFF8DE2
MKNPKNLLDEQECNNVITKMIMKRFENSSYSALTRMIQEIEQIADILKWDKDLITNIDPLLFIYNEVHFACNNSISSYTIQTSDSLYIIRNYPKDLLSRLVVLYLCENMENIRKSTVNDFTHAQMK